MAKNFIPHYQQAAAVWVAQNTKHLNPIAAVKELQRTNGGFFEDTLNLIPDDADVLYVFDGFVAFRRPWTKTDRPFGFTHGDEETFAIENDMLLAFGLMVVGLAGIPHLVAKGFPAPPAEAQSR